MGENEINMIKLLNILSEIIFESIDISNLIYSSEVKDNIKNNNVPLTDAVINLLYPKERIKVFHMASADEVDTIKRIINKENAISCFTETEKSKIENVSFNLNSKVGGILFHLEGQKVFSSTSDLGSSVDKSGRRWVSYKKFPQEFQNEFLKYDKNNINNLETLKKYYIFINKLIVKYLDQIKIKNSSKENTHGDWDEVVVKKIKILGILVNPKRIYPTPDAFSMFMDEPPFSEEELIKKLKSISSDVSILSDKNEILNWFTTKGGKIK